MNERTENPSILFNQKMNKVFGDILNLDWEPDKGYELTRGGKTLRYVSIGKIKRQLGRCFCNNRINFSVSFVEPQMLNDQLCIKSIVTFTDADTGYSESTTSLGCSKNGEKAMQIAQSYALKSCLLNKFFIIDGIEPEEEEENAIKYKGTHVVSRKTPEEINEIKSKISDIAIEVQDTDAKPTEKAKDEPVAKQAGEYTPTGIETKTIDTILTKWASKLKANEVTKEQYDNMMARYNAGFDTKEKALQFIKEFRVL